MQIRVFSIPYVAGLGGFNDEPLRTFLSDKEVLDLHVQFFVKDGAPYWTVLVQYNLLAEPEAKQKSGAESSGSDWRKRLKQGDWGLFNRLREWRLERSKSEGVPAYMLFTNHQLTDIALLRPGSLAALGQLAGVGPGRVEKYGKEILNLLGNASYDRNGEEKGSGSAGAAGMAGVSGLAVADDGEAAEAGALHAGEPDGQSGAGLSGEVDNGPVHAEPESDHRGGEPDSGQAAHPDANLP